MKMDVSIVSCPDYAPENVSAALKQALSPVDELDWVRPGMKIAIKTNLVAPLRPDSAAVTHPTVVAELSRILTERGAEVIVGDSPGGPWNAAWVGTVYTAAGLRSVEDCGARLNHDFSQRDAEFPEAAVLKKFPYTSWLDGVDAVINCCKLKTHGLTGMSCAVKNFYGVIPGTRKPEYHYLYAELRDFAMLLVDLFEYVKPCLTVVDAVTCMEGNGPTQGTPRHMGALLCAKNGYAADLVCAELIGLEPGNVPTIKAAVERKLCPDDISELNIFGDPQKFALPDFEKLPTSPDGWLGVRPKFVTRFLEKNFRAMPKLEKSLCTGCGKCAEVCPRKTISIRENRAVIHRGDCIRCFCCQEFCPNGAMKVYRPFLARVLGE